MSKTFIDKIKLDLSIVCVSRLEEPQIFSSVKFFIRIALEFLLGCTDVRDSLNAMASKYIADINIICIVQNTEESIFFSLFIGILNSSEFVVNTITFITSLFHSKKSDYIVWARIFNDKLLVLGNCE